MIKRRSLLSKKQEKHLLETYFQTRNKKHIPNHISQFGAPDSDTTDDEFYFITSYVKSIDTLVLRGSFVTANGLERLKKLEQVYYLDLGSMALSDNNLDCILHFHQLEYLYIKHTDVSAAGIYSLLKSFPLLKTIVANLQPGDEEWVIQWKKEFPHCDLMLNL